MVAKGKHRAEGSLPTRAAGGPLGHAHRGSPHRGGLWWHAGEYDTLYCAMPAPASRASPPVMATERAAAVWDTIWAQGGTVTRVIALARAWMHALHRRILGPHCTPETRLLELGCGPASLSLSLAPSVAEVVGLDISPEAVRQAQQSQRALGIVNATFQLGDCRAVPYADAFDLVWSAGLIEHFFDHDLDVVREHLKAARPGGVVLMSTPHRYSLHFLHYVLTRPRVLRWLWPWSDESRFQKFYSWRGLWKLVAATGVQGRVFLLPPWPIGLLLGIAVIELRKPDRQTERPENLLG